MNAQQKAILVKIAKMIANGAIHAFMEVVKMAYKIAIPDFIHKWIELQKERRSQEDTLRKSNENLKLAKDFEQAKIAINGIDKLTLVSSALINEFKETLTQRVNSFGLKYWLYCCEILADSQIQRLIGLPAMALELSLNFEGLAKLAVGLITIMKRSSCASQFTAFCFRRIIEGQIQEKKIDIAQRFFSFVYSIGYFGLVDKESIKICQRILEILIKELLVLEEYDKAVFVLDSIFSFAEKPTDVFFNKILDFLSKRKSFPKFSERLLGVMIKNNTKASLITFNTLLDLYISQKNYTMMWHLFASLVEKNDPKPDNFTYSIMINGVKNMPDQGIERAFELYDEYKVNHSADLIIANSLLDACVSMNAWDHLNRLICEIENSPSMKFDEVTYNTLIKACTKKREYGNAKQYFSEMKRAKIKPNKITFNSMMNLAIRERNLPLALSYLEEMKCAEINPDQFTYSIVLNGIKCCNCTMQDYVQVIEMLEGLMVMQKIKPDEIFYNSLIDVATKFKDFARAERLFEKMKTERLRPSAVTYGILIKAYGRSKNIQKAQRLFDELKNENIKPNEITYGCILDAYSFCGKMDLAESIFRELRDTKGLKLNPIIYTTLIKGFSIRGEYMKAIQYFEIMESDSNVEPNIISYNCVIDVAVRANDISRALTYFNALRSKFKPDMITYSTIIKGYCGADRLDEAIEMLSNMASQGAHADEQLFNLVLYSCACPKFHRKGIKVFSLMKEVGARPNQITCGTMMKIYGLSGMLKEAFELLKYMKTKNIESSLIVFTNLIHNCFKNGHPESAEEAFRMMEEDEISSDKICYTKMVDGLRQARLFKRACFYVKKAFEMGAGVRQEALERLRGALGNKGSKKYSQEVKMISGFISELPLIKTVETHALMVIKQSKLQKKTFRKPISEANPQNRTKENNHPVPCSPKQRKSKPKLNTKKSPFVMPQPIAIPLVQPSEFGKQSSKPLTNIR